MLSETGVEAASAHMDALAWEDDLRLRRRAPPASGWALEEELAGEKVVGEEAEGAREREVREAVREAGRGEEVSNVRVEVGEATSEVVSWERSVCGKDASEAGGRTTWIALNVVAGRTTADARVGEEANARQARTKVGESARRHTSGAREGSAVAAEGRRDSSWSAGRATCLLLPRPTASSPRKRP